MINNIQNNPMIDKYGIKHWYFNGKHHRIDGPAYEGNYEYKIWYVNGRLYRLDGPAIKRPKDDLSTDAWYINGKKIDDIFWLNKLIKLPK